MNCGLASGGGAGGSGELHAVGGVEHHGPAEAAHDGEAAHIDDQIVVAERSAALGDQNFVVAGGGDLLGGVLDIVRRDELALLDIHDAAGAAGGDQQIGLAAEECRDLQNVDGLRRRASACAGSWMSVSTGMPVSRTLFKMRRPSVRPGPR